MEHVVARIYDPRRAEVYQRLGIPTVATVSWTAGQIMRRLLPQGAAVDYEDPSGHVVLAEVPVHEDWIGERVVRMEEVARVRVGFLTRLGSGMVPTRDSVLQDGDLVHVMYAAGDREHVEEVLGAPPRERPAHAAGDGEES